jgi:hypothetical protein
MKFWLSTSVNLLLIHPCGCLFAILRSQRAEAVRCAEFSIGPRGGKDSSKWLKNQT